MDENLIAGYLSSNSIDFSTAIHNVYTFSVKLENRCFYYVKLFLVPAGNYLHVVCSFPLRIERTQGYQMLNALTWINFELGKHQNYEYDACTESFRFHMIVNFPASADELASVIQECIDIVTEDADTIMESYNTTYENLHIGKDALYCSQKGNDIVDNNSCEADQTAPVYKNTGMQSHWKERGTDTVISFSEMQEIIIANRGQVLLIEGPTGCGKSLLLRQLQHRETRKIAIVSSEVIVDYFIHVVIRKYKDPFEKIANDHDIICIENIDMLRGKSTEIEAAFIIKRLIEKQKTVIINGIKCTQRTPHMLELLKDILRIFQFVEE